MVLHLVTIQDTLCATCQGILGLCSCDLSFLPTHARCRVIAFTGANWQTFDRGFDCWDATVEIAPGPR